MLEDHRGGPRHDSLLSAYPQEDGNSGWMISYIDIMTLLVALFVVIIAAADISPGGAQEDTLVGADQDTPDPAVEAPLPAPISGELSPVAVSAALGVAGPQPRPALVPAPSAPPALLARRDVAIEAAIDEAPSQATPVLEWLLPTPLFASSAGEGPQVRSPPPLADYMVILTDRPPVNVVALDETAIQGAIGVTERLNARVADSPYLPNLEGVEVARVAEGISLRVQDQLLFPSAEAELTDGGTALVGSLLETIQRFDGEVWVEGHSDSRTINTPAFSSNWALSSARAIAIVEALEAAGVAPSRLRAVGLADTRPLADNATLEGRARNRRVEVVIHVE
ncbi:OmpA family protein [Halomonas sp. 707D7]|uniref:OmpA family protein n=1 Tax=Halomonas sp. 707D7 TaxID=1681044 RepID=UPI00209E001A|nr:OmpA family protein [Halomonas sp. 707D7]MCP1314305.1 OmpA family protein [Halomonas sp. 707D7]